MADHPPIDNPGRLRRTVVLVSGGTVFLLAVWLANAFRLHRIGLAEARAQTTARMRACYLEITADAIARPKTFVSVVGSDWFGTVEELKTKLSSLDEKDIRAVQPTADKSLDSWRRPIRVHITKAHRSSDVQTNEFRILIFSDGKNGQAEQGVGDDLSLDCGRIIVPIEGGSRTGTQ